MYPPGSRHLGKYAQGLGGRGSNPMLLSINSKVEIKEISSVNTERDFHFHRTFLPQTGGPGSPGALCFARVLVGLRLVWLRRGVGIRFACKQPGFWPPFVCQEGANPTQRALHVVAICAVYGFHVALPNVPESARQGLFSGSLFM